jgi:hypothetical protein
MTRTSTTCSSLVVLVLVRLGRRAIRENRQGLVEIDSRLGGGRRHDTRLFGLVCDRMEERTTVQ